MSHDRRMEMAKKICFINPPDNWADKKGDRPPLGLAYLSSYLKQFGHETFIIDLNHDTLNDSPIYDKFVKQNLEPDFICVTVPTPNYNTAIDLATDMKVTFPKCKIIAGGAHVAGFPNEPKTLTSFDYIVTGTDGEEALLRIVEGKVDKCNCNPKSLFHGMINNCPKCMCHPCSCNKGIIVKSIDIDNLDDLPYSDYEGLNLKRYKMKVGGKKGLMLVASRGCIFSCFYCGSATIKKFRAHTPEYVIQHMKLLYDKYDIRGFYFGDDIFTLKFDRVFKMCELINKEFPKKDITIRITTRSNLLTGKLCIAMKESGIDIISIGLESGSPKVLKSMRKHETVEIQERGVDYCYKAGIKVKGFFIFGNPDETWEDILLTINFAKRLVKSGKLNYADVYILNPIPASPFWQNPEEFKIKAIKPKDSDWSNYYQIGKGGHIKVNIRHPHLSSEQLNDAVELFHKEVNVGGLTYE